MALRLVTGVVGIDMDAYGGKQGERTLTRLEQLLGSLPATVVSTSRTDGVSGIGLFQVPPDRLWTPSVRAQQGRLVQHICRVVDFAPPPPDAQRDRLAVLLQSPRTSS